MSPFIAALALIPCIAVITFAIGRLRLPAYIALTAAALAFGLGAGLTLQAAGRAFGLGFAAAIEEIGLLFAVGALVALVLGRGPASLPVAGGLGLIGGLGAAAAAGLALLQAAASGHPRRSMALALALLTVHAMIPPSPLAIAAAATAGSSYADALVVAAPAGLVGLILGLAVALRQLPSDANGNAPLGFVVIVLLVPLALLILQSAAQIPSEPLGRGAPRDIFTSLSRPLPLAIVALTLALIAVRRWPGAAFEDVRWALPLLAIGAAGGFSRVLDTTGMAELVGERVLQPQLGLLAPFLVAAIVKTLQGSSLTAVLTASGMTEEMLPALGLDSFEGRALATAAIGAGSLTVCHLNDPFFWIAAAMAGFTPGRALRILTLGSAVIGLGAFAVLAVLGQVLL